MYIDELPGGIAETLWDHSSDFYWLWGIKGLKQLVREQLNQTMLHYDLFILNYQEWLNYNYSIFELTRKMGLRVALYVQVLRSWRNMGLIWLQTLYVLDRLNSRFLEAIHEELRKQQAVKKKFRERKNK
jgi:hypothetical protein